MSKRLKLIPVLAFAAATFAATAALAANDSETTHNCFRARDWLNWKSPAPNVLLVRVSPNRLWRLDLQQGSDQLTYPDMRIINRSMKSAWLCVPSDFDLLLTDRENILRQGLIVTAVRQLTPEEISAIPQRDLP